MPARPARSPRRTLCSAVALALAAPALAVAVAGTAHADTAVVNRLAGADRYATAVAVSQSTYPSTASAVVLARGGAYPDALVGVTLAAAKNAPLLLTDGATLPSATQAEISRVLTPGGTVYILGGTASVPLTVQAQLAGLGYQVVRYAGADRYATAVVVADALGDPSPTLLADGTNFPDALSAGPAAHHAGGVVLLTAGSTLPPATATYLAGHAGTAYAIGGPAAAADPSATPIVGADRFATSTLVADTFFTGPTSVGVATGTAFPDALAGGAQQAHLGGPLLLSAGTTVPSAVLDYLTANNTTVTAASLYGGTTSLTGGVLDAVQAALFGQPIPTPAVADFSGITSSCVGGVANIGGLFSNTIAHQFSDVQGQNAFASFTNNLHNQVMLTAVADGPLVVTFQYSTDGWATTQLVTFTAC